MKKTDFLVIGSGIAGLSFALKASKFGDVTIITKDWVQESNTFFAQGGLAAVFSKDDSFELHVRDTLRAGDGLCNKKAAEILIKNAPKEIKWLEKIGVRFDRNGRLSLSKEAVHSKARIVHSGDITGREVENVLVKNIGKNKRIRLYQNHMAVDLIVEKNRCLGACVLDIKNNKLIDVFAKGIVLATGGIGRIYANTCNHGIATGDGIAAAYLAGAELQDMEFMQFHPTGLYKSDPTFLISETLRGEGGVLKNKYGKRFMPGYHRDGDVAPRDVVSKFSLIEMRKTKSNCVWLDVTSLGSAYLKKRFPNIRKECLVYGADLAKEPIPVAPTAHYICGGVRTNLNGETSIKNLYAIGEVSCSGLHGADRLASNSLTDGLVFGTRLVNKLKKSIKKEKINIKEIIKSKNQLKIIKKSIKKTKSLKNKLKELMWDKVGIIRNKKGLSSALKDIKKIEKETGRILNDGINKEILELRNMVIVSKTITMSALGRKESRGTHFIDEYPIRNDRSWQKHSLIKKSGILKFFK
ncbi:L-aspartate oxidase [Candidatus Woesearchaeota archaeon]|nr:L-aspartate oxidase [Candidatus Woesearchaeota archaeon]